MTSPTPSNSSLSNSDVEMPDPSVPSKVKCVICHNPLSTPRLLRCLHSCCLACIERAVGPGGRIFICPDCHACTDIPEGGPVALLPDYSLGVGVDSSAPSINGTDIANSACSGCWRGSTVVARCKDCNCVLCTECVESHKEMSYFRHHRVVPLSAINGTEDVFSRAKCSRHSGQVLMYFCSDCCTPQCSICVVCDQHHIEFISPLNNALQAQTSLLSSYEKLAGLKVARLKEMKTEVNCASIRLQEQQKQAKMAIRDTYAVFMAALEAKQTEEIQKVDTLFASKQALLGNSLQELNLTIHSLGDGSSFIRRLMLLNNAVELLMSVKSIADRMNQLLTYQPTLVDTDIAFSTDYQSIPSVVHAHFGQVTQPSSVKDIVNMSSSANGHVNRMLQYIVNQPTSSPPYDMGSIVTVEQKAAAELAANFINMERLVISPQNGLGSSHDSSSVPTFDSRGSSSPPNGLNGDIFSTADMFQGGESNRTSKKGVDESVPPKSKVPRLKIDSIHKFGDYGSAPGLFSEPSGVAINPLNGNILIADTNNHRVEIFSSNGDFLFEINVCGKDDGQLLYPNRVTVCKRSGNIVITERSPTHQVQVYNSSGKFLRRFGGNVLQHPRGVVVDSQGRIIVVECKVQRVVVFNQNDGAVVQRFSCSPHLDFPVGVAANAERDEIYISDNRGHAVKVFSYGGSFLRQIGGAGITNYPIGVGVCPTGEIVVADNHNNFNLTVFTPDGQLITALEGRMKHQQCYDVAFADDGTVVLTCKDYHAYIYRFRGLSSSISPASFLQELAY